MATKRSPGPTKVPPISGKVVNAAIDFGTANSGYAFSFRHKPLTIYTNAWQANGAALTATKAPTCVLLNQNGEFDSFGFDAEEKYSELAEKDEHEGWYYFQKFKMELYKNENLSRETMIKDIAGKEMSAMTIFIMVISELKRCLMSDVQQNVVDEEITETMIQHDDIFWILTVPAIWSDAAKQFMREAANGAGITNDQLKLVLEPEAASLYCQANCNRRSIQAGGIVDLTPFPPGYKYIVADLGGGTADIATHEVLEDNNLREIYRASGGKLGACRVDLAFLTFLANLIGPDTLDRYRLNNRIDFIELLNEFEIRKRKVKSTDPSPLLLRFPASLREFVETENGISLEECIKKENYDNLVAIKRGDKMQIKAKLIDVFFREPVAEIVEKLRGIIENERFKIDALLLVGGFADSPYVRETIAKEFPDLQIKKPEEASLHVLKGAVLTRIRPYHISERIARYTYGFRVVETFNRHPDNLRQSRASGDFCDDVFHSIITKDDHMKSGKKLNVDFGGNVVKQAENKYEPVSVDLYRSTKHNPKVCTADDDCERIGNITIKPPADGWPEHTAFEAELFIGETEFHMSVKEIVSKRTFGRPVDFLR